MPYVDIGVENSKRLDIAKHFTFKKCYKHCAIDEAQTISLECNSHNLENIFPQFCGLTQEYLRTFYKRCKKNYKKIKQRPYIIYIIK